MMTDKVFHALRVNQKGEDFFHCEVEKQSISSLPDHDTLIRVHYSSLNYKDALSAHGHKGVTRSFPHTPGIDAAGVVEETSADGLSPGDEVIVTGFDLGMNTPGGFGEYIRVPASWCVKKPANHGLEYFMILGTAGLTAGLSVDRLLTTIKPEDGEVLVTGATGGVGSLGVALLDHLNFKAVALTSKVDHSDMLVKLGAHRVIDRSVVEDLPDKPMLKETWAGILDTVGGTLFSKALKTVQHSGAATTCGMVAGTALETSIFPFILRGISLFGIDSVEIPTERKADIWKKFDQEWALDNIEHITHRISLTELPAAIERIHCGKMLGRVVLKHKF